MRVKRGVTSHQRHQKIRHATKGMTRPNRSSVKRGRQAVVKGLQHAYRDRRNKKRTFRSLWNARINAAARINGTTYSKLIAALKGTHIDLNRKVLAELAVNEPAAFTAVVNSASADVSQVKAAEK
ncbi:50S ribosomal protein L20 [Candidatus Saccharibacteria bacterium]|nr:50S ribosomal protein L20 [Candidatus Saccharibacteria bacterium]